MHLVTKKDACCFLTHHKNCVIIIFKSFALAFLILNFCNGSEMTLISHFVHMLRLNYLTAKLFGHGYILELLTLPIFLGKTKKN